MTTTLNRMLARLHSPLPRDATTTNYKLLQCLDDQVTRQDSLVTSIQQNHWINSVGGGSLDLIGQLVNLPRNTGEADNSYRLRIIAEVARFQSRARREDILSFVATAAGTPITSVMLVENTDAVTGLFQPHYYYVGIPTSGLVAQGFTTQPQLVAVLALLQTLLTRVDADGVLGQVLLGGTFTYEGDGATFGPAGVGTNANGYWVNLGDPAAYGNQNDGGYWGGLPM